MFVAAGGASFDCLVEYLLYEPGIAELANVAGKQRGHELPFSEDPFELAVGVDHGQGGQAAVEDGPDGLLNSVVVAQEGRFADEVATEAVWAHGCPLIGTG